MENVTDQARQLQLPRFAPGEIVSAHKLNQLSDAIGAPLSGFNPPKPVQYPQLFLGSATQFVITANDDGDFLTCQKWNGQASGNDIYVSKPYLLQQSTLDGVTDDEGIRYTFTGIDALTALDTGSSVSEDWVVNFPYRVGYLIYAIGNVIGGIDNETEVEYIDLNLDGRAWAKVLT